MNYTLVFIFLLFASCGESYQPANTVSTVAKDTFVYKELMEEYVLDTIEQKNIPDLFGKWKIVEIAQTGGTFRTESLIRQQIGKELSLDSSRVLFDFLGNTIEVINPRYELEITNTAANQEHLLKGTSYFHRYRPCRDNVLRLIISKRLYFEIIHWEEMTTYNEGRIYFLRKLE